MRGRVIERGRIGTSMKTVRMKGVFREKEIYKWEKVVFGYLYTVISVKFLS